MKLKRVKGGKGQRWKKGHSCISNPENSSHRESAKGNFFQKLDGESGLTVEALAKHTASLAVGGPKLCADPEDDRSVGKTFNTFATNFTTCTLPAFEKFFRNFTVESDLQTRMLAIHAAAQEYIQDANLNESSTAYMCALMASLEGVKHNDDDVTATLSLLVKVIRKVNKEVLKAKFGEYSQLLDELFTHFSTTSNTKLLINIIGCLSVLLRAQDEIQWSYSYTRNLFHKIISFSTHEIDDVRRAAQYNASAMLKGSSFMVSEASLKMNQSGEEMRGGTMKDEEEEEVVVEGSGATALPVFRAHPVADLCGKFIATNLKLASENMNGKTTLHLLSFLQQIITCLPKKTLEQCCSLVLGVMHIGDNVVSSRSLKVFSALFSTKTNEMPVSALTIETNEALISALTSTADTKHCLRLVPSMNDCDLSTLWMSVVAAGVVHLTKLNSSSGFDRFSLWMPLLSSFWKSEFEEVHEKVWHVIDFFIDECVKPLKENVTIHTGPQLIAFQHIEKCLSLQFKSAWPYVFSSLAAFFEVMGAHSSLEMVPCLKNLSSLITTPDLKGKRQLENVFGAAIGSMGPEEVLKVIPLQITGNIKEDETHMWILPIIKKHTVNARLCFFKSYFLHLAEKCRIILDKLSEQGKMSSLIAKTYEVIERQLWSLFPSFANGAVDVDGALSKEFVILIRDHIKLREDTRLDVMSALRNMLAVSSRTSPLAMYHGKELLPVLFGIYLMKPRDKFPEGMGHHLIDPGQRLAALSTIEVFFRILRSDKITLFFNKLLEKLNSEGSDAFTHRALLSLSKTFLPYLNSPTLDIIYKKAEGGIASKDSNLQKVAFRIIEEVLSTDSEACKLYVDRQIDSIFSLLLASSLVIPSARAPRLKCFQKMLLHHLPTDATKGKRDDFLRQVVQEAIKCCGQESSTPTRKTAFALLSEVGKMVQKVMELSNEDTFLHCFALLPSVIPPSHLSPNTVLAMMALLYQYKEIVPAHTLDRTVRDVSTLLLECNDDGHILKASLSFIRMMFAYFPPPVMSDYVDVVVESIVSLGQEGRKKFRLKIRDILASLIRKFGDDRIKALIPEDDPILKMLTNLVKKDRRQKRTRKESETREERMEALTSLDEILTEIDREIENDERKEVPEKGNLKRKKLIAKKKTWIREEKDEIMDLLDSSSGQHISNKKPKKKLLRFDDRQGQTDEEKYGFRVDRKTKKFIITERSWDEEDKKNSDSEENPAAAGELFEIAAKNEDKSASQSKRKRTISEGSNDSNQPSKRHTAVSTGTGKRTAMKNKFDYGAEFKSRKAGGDVSKKGGVLPYAYVQFSKDKLNKRKKAKYSGQFRRLVRGAKKGAAKGTKMKIKNK